MSKSRNAILIWMLAIVVMLSASSVFGQSNPKAGYLEYTGENQSRNIPAGVVMDPASHLTYLIDTGYNLRELSGDVSLVSLVGAGTEQDVVDNAGVSGADGLLDLDPAENNFSLYTNFVTITNTHPTMAVTIHFRYFNDNCDDVLDFLVVLTCNDTLVFNPLDFDIPFTGENTRSRFFRTSGSILSPLTAQDWGSGRFIITAAASGVSIDTDTDAEILFPNEYGGPDHCNIESDGSLNGTLNDILAGNVQNKGENNGLTDTNLHVFNASQISFNFLIGSQATAVAASQKAISGWLSMAYGVAAWGRPAVDRTTEVPLPGNDPSNLTGYPDGDGPAATTGLIVTGGEDVYQANRVNFVDRNWLSLRNDVHGGDVRQDQGVYSDGGHSEYGALATTSFMGNDPDNIIQHFISVADDYNGSSNTGVVGEADRAANIVPAATTYVMQMYDNDEDLLVIPPTTPLNISPPKPGTSVELKLVCFCLRTFLTETIAAGTNVDDLTIREINDIFTPASLANYANAVLNGGGQVATFDGFIVGGTDPGDVSHGWIRWVRDITHQVVITPAIALEVGATVIAAAHNVGTSTFDQAVPILVDIVIDDEFGPSFLTQALQVIVFQPNTTYAYGAANWEFSSASDCAVSEWGLPDATEDDEGCTFPNSAP